LTTLPYAAAATLDRAAGSRWGRPIERWTHDRSVTVSRNGYGAIRRIASRLGS
jgi:hypothetical protein